MIPDLEVLERSLKMVIPPGGCIIFVVKEEDITAADQVMQKIAPILRARNICALLFSDDTTVIVVPEARRVVPIVSRI